MRKTCSWVSVLIAGFVGALVVVFGLLGALADLNIIYFIVLGIAVLGLVLLTVYVLRREYIRIDLRCLLYSAFVTLLTSVAGIIFDVLALLELPLLFAAISSVVLVLISAFQLLRTLIHRGG